MKVVKYKNDKIPEDFYAIVSNILHDAFEERRQQNIYFKCGEFTPLEVKQDLTGESYLFLVYNDDDVPVGTASLKIRRKGGYCYGGFENLGVVSFFKRRGIASILAKERLQLAKDLNLDFLTSTTACNAKSSVKYHKKMGFLIYMKSYGKGYNSYNYILPLNKLNFLKIRPLRFILFVLATSIGAIKRNFK